MNINTSPDRKDEHHDVTEKRKDFGPVTPIALGNSFYNEQGMLSVCKTAGSPQSASHLMEGSKAMGGMKHGR